MHLTCNDLSKEVGMIFQSAAVAVSRYSCPVIALPKLFYRKQYPKTFHIKKKKKVASFKYHEIQELQTEPGSFFGTSTE